jgi:hypothetical protein
MDHILLFASIRTGVLYPALASNLPIHANYLVRIFDGNTSQVVVIYFSPPGCLRVLDPEIDSQNKLLPPVMRAAAALNNYSTIRTDSPAEVPMALFGPESGHGWCYYFEQADLARQMGDWPRVVKLGDVAFKLNDYPNDPIERFAFIEGYAHEENYAQARELSLESYKVSPNYVGPLLCLLWQRLDRETPDSSNKKMVLNDLLTKFSCTK